MKYAIIGSRQFPDLELVRHKVREIRYNGYNPNEMLFISGGAAGVDKTAIEQAKAFGLETLELKPDMSAGYDVKQYHLRNDKIIETADKVIAFWDGQSKGTESVILKCLQRHKNLEVIFSE